MEWSHALTGSGGRCDGDAKEPLRRGRTRTRASGGRALRETFRWMPESRHTYAALMIAAGNTEAPSSYAGH